MAMAKAMTLAANTALISTEDRHTDKQTDKQTPKARHRVATQLKNTYKKTILHILCYN